MAFKLTNRPARPPLLQVAPALDANALELFARIVAAGSFAQAARDVNLTRAAVSRRVAHVEAQLGTPLFTRTTRALGLTETGRRLAARARAVHEAADAARRSLRSRAATGEEGLTGNLRISSVPMFGHAVLAPLLARFQAQHPALRIELRFTLRRVDLVREDIDVAFRLTEKLPPDCVATPVLRYQVRAYAAPLPGVPFNSPQDLAHNRCLQFGVPADELTMVWHRREDPQTLPTSNAAAPMGQPVRPAQTEAVTVQPAMVGDDLGTLQAVARAAGGVLLAPDFCVLDDVANGRLVDALPGWHLPVPIGSLVQALTLPLPVAPESARALVHFVRDACFQLPRMA